MSASNVVPMKSSAEAKTQEKNDGRNRNDGESDEGDNPRDDDGGDEEGAPARDEGDNPRGEATIVKEDPMEEWAPENLPDVTCSAGEDINPVCQCCTRQYCPNLCC